MKIRRMSYGLVFALAASHAVACGEPPPVEAPPPPPPPTEAPPPATTAEPAATAAPTAAPTAEAPPAPPPKPAKEKFVGKWVQDWSGDVKTAAEEDAKKKAGKNDKDGKKLAELMKKAEEAVVKHSFENSGDVQTGYEGEKVVRKIKYEVVKEDGATLVIKHVGKDEISKKEAKGEIAVTFKDDNTLEMKDPMAKDPAKASTLIFKRK